MHCVSTYPFKFANMQLPKIKFKTVDEYIGYFPKNIAALLKKMRATIKKAAPEAVEGIGYNMPAYKLNGKPLVYFAGYEKHIGFYAIPTAHEKFKDELKKYKSSKGSVQFPVDEPLPLDLVTLMVKFRVEENSQKTKAQKKKA
jgi:uncharacterized protein YdhG (YjbR/CyaY superfamily)